MSMAGHKGVRLKLLAPLCPGRIGRPSLGDPVSYRLARQLSQRTLPIAFILLATRPRRLNNRLESPF